MSTHIAVHVPQLSNHIIAYQDLSKALITQPAALHQDFNQNTQHIPPKTHRHARTTRLDIEIGAGISVQQFYRSPFTAAKSANNRFRTVAYCMCGYCQERCTRRATEALEQSERLTDAARRARERGYSIRARAYTAQARVALTEAKLCNFASREGFLEFLIGTIARLFSFLSPELCTRLPRKWQSYFVNKSN